MKRLQILAMVGAMVALTAFGAVPAMAQPDGCFFDANGNLVCPNQFPNQFVTSPFGTSGAAPAEQGFSERRISSGAANPVTRISNTGDNVNLCAPVQQVANTGNVANEQGVVEDNSNGFSTNGFFPVDNFGSGFGGELDFEGSSIDVAPDLSSTCDQTINQSAAA